MKSRSISRRSVRIALRRRGAAMTEAAFALPIFLLVVFATLDMGIIIFRQHQITTAASALARQAVVHGSEASKLGVWGPSSLSGTAADGSAIGKLLATQTTGARPNAIRYEISWPDGGNKAASDHRVRVVVSATHQPIVTGLFGVAPLTLSSSTTSVIAH